MIHHFLISLKMYALYNKIQAHNLQIITPFQKSNKGHPSAVSFAGNYLRRIYNTT